MSVLRAVYESPGCPLGFVVGFGSKCCEDLVLSGA